ncbi:MAG: hypothetical protein HOP30_13400 [Cyclobacteriaceae bacterium]|nr:hypothetical protein [Cyclobacteriaceae bacterium]
MKTETNILKFVILTIIIGCGQTANQDGNSTYNNDSIPNTTPKNELTKEERQIQIEEDNRMDRIRLDIALKDAFKISQKEFKTDNFTKQYELQPDDSSYTIHMDIEIGRLFKDQHKYFLLRRHVPWATYLSLYKINGDKTENLIEREQGGMTYIRDTIFDANGDGHKDFLVHWYPSSGCCRRDVYNVYLNQPDKGNFTQDYKFINPTFSAKEKIIRGVEYGHPGEVGLYKYKWNGLQVDTIEFIYPDAINQGQFIKTKRRSYRPTEKEGVVLKSVPKEYLKIESYEWFADF